VARPESAVRVRRPRSRAALELLLAAAAIRSSSRRRNVDARIQDSPSFAWRADAALVLARGRADINSLTVTSGKSELHFAGQLQDFHNPRVSGEYHGLADLGALASLLRQPQVRTGTAQFAGKGSWSIQTFSTEGNVQGKEIEWSNGRVLLRNGRISASFSVTPDRLRVSSIKANLFGGDVRGDADVTNWKDSAEPSPCAASARPADESLPKVCSAVRCGCSWQDFRCFRRRKC